MNGKYPKIQSIYKRHNKTHEFIEGKYSLPEFEYLADLQWQWQEKIDGTNIRIIWDGEFIKFRGRTDKAEIPKHLVNLLLDKTLDFYTLYPDKPMCLYGEGFGMKIQGGGKYIPDGVDFILFDVLIDDIWLQRKDVEDIGDKLGIRVVPIVGIGTLQEAIEAIKEKTLISTFGSFLMEGLVLKPMIPLMRRNGDRIITKVKHVDYKD
jgi:hypothetical protein